MKRTTQEGTGLTICSRICTIVHRRQSKENLFRLEGFPYFIRRGDITESLIEEHNVAVIHRFTGSVGENYAWEGERVQQYPGAVLKWLLGKAEDVPTFALRYFELPPGASSNPEEHPYEHGLIIMRGCAKLFLGPEKQESQVEPLDIVFIPPDEYHQIVNHGEEVFGAFCTIPAYRKKGDTVVYAEGDLKPADEDRAAPAEDGESDDQ